MNRLAGATLVYAMAWGGDLRRAEELYRRTDYRGVLQELQAEKSGEARVLALAGKSAYMLGEFKQASEYFEKAAAAEPRSSETFHWLGRAYGRRAETSSFLTAPKYAAQCRKSFEKAVELEPKNGEALNDLFSYYLEAPGFLGGGTEKAWAAARRIAELDAVEGQHAFARLAERRKEYNTAESHLREAAEMAPGQLGRVIELAKFLARQGRHEESEALFAKAERIDAGAPKLLFERAQTYIEQKRNLQQARKLLERYLESKLTPEDPPREEAERLLKRASGV